MTPNDDFSGRTAPLTSKCCILYIYSKNIGTEYFKQGIYSPFFPLQNAVCFIILTYLIPVLFTFYIQGVQKLKNNSGAKRLSSAKAPNVTGEFFRQAGRTRLPVHLLIFRQIHSEKFWHLKIRFWPFSTQ